MNKLPVYNIFSYLLRGVGIREELSFITQVGLLPLSLVTGYSQRYFIVSHPS